MITPCMNCKERKINCHSDCKKYLEYRAIRDKISDNRQERVEHDCYTNIAYDRMRRLRRHDKR